ncbi:MAG: hypothetical protein R6W48_03995 [Gaiellaceae bacterium]
MEASPDARRALLGRLIDHAPQFPPAALELSAAVAEDERARESRHAFVLARYVCPASRLAELPEVGRGVSVVLDAPFSPESRVEAVETPFRDDLDGLRELAEEAYVEVPLGDSAPGTLDRLASLGLHAKVRCGGASVPSVAELGGFVRACRERQLAFKATAGLHHAVRRNGEHGLLNLLAATAFGEEERALEEDDASAFALDAESFSWRDRSLGAGELLRVRRGGLHTVGSCSFFEPVDELVALGMLPR